MSVWPDNSIFKPGTSFSSLTRRLSSALDSGDKADLPVSKKMFFKVILLPTAIFYDGHSWKFRAFHREDNSGRGMFKCFNFSRVLDADELHSDAAKEYEVIDKDHEWNLTVPVHLEVHPLLGESDKETVKKDFGLSDDESELVVTERAALLYFLKKHWAIDDNEVPTNDRYYNFYLKNYDDLKAY